MTQKCPYFSLSGQIQIFQILILHGINYDLYYLAINTQFWKLSAHNLTTFFFLHAPNIDPTLGLASK